MCGGEGGGGGRGDWNGWDGMGLDGLGSDGVGWLRWEWVGWDAGHDLEDIAGFTRVDANVRVWIESTSPQSGTCAAHSLK